MRPFLRRGVSSSRQIVQRCAHTLPAVVQTRAVPIHLYADIDSIESQALQQLKALAESGICEGFVAAMPDVHLGKGAAIGTVYASRNFVAPNGVGVDIGCGMAAVPVEGMWRDELVADSGKFQRAALEIQRLSAPSSSLR